jgi:hypothetical protein
LSRSDWLLSVDPPVPSGFGPWLALPGETSDEAEGPLPDPGTLTTAAMAALGRALAPEGRERGGAFDLLAADAFATWAAEAALAGPAVEERLVGLRDRLAGGAGTG